MLTQTDTQEQMFSAVISVVSPKFHHCEEMQPYPIEYHQLLDLLPVSRPSWPCVVRESFATLRTFATASSFDSFPLEFAVYSLSARLLGIPLTSDSSSTGQVYSRVFA